MGAEAETPQLIPELSSRNPVEEREEKLYEQELGSRSWQGKPQRQLTLAQGRSMTLDQHLGYLHGTNLGHLHVGDSCVT